MPEYDNILTEIPVDKVGLIRLNRPKALNALNNALMGELHDALRNFDNDPEISCMVITGNERAFAAGADIKEMAGQTYVDFLQKVVSAIILISANTRNRLLRQSVALLSVVAVKCRWHVT